MARCPGWLRRLRRLVTPTYARAYREGAQHAPLALTGHAFHDAFDGSSIGAAVVSLQGRILDTNETLEEMLGYSRGELVGTAVTDVTHPDDYAVARALYWDLLSGHRDRYQLEKRYVRRDGSVLRGRLNVSLLRDPDGTPRYLLGLLENLEDKGARAAALRRLPAPPER